MKQQLLMLPKRDWVNNMANELHQTEHIDTKEGLILIACVGIDDELAELKKMAEEEEQVEVGCQFCDKKYVFTRHQLKELAK